MGMGWEWKRKFHSHGNREYNEYATEHVDTWNMLTYKESRYCITNIMNMLYKCDLT